MEDHVLSPVAVLEDPLADRGEGIQAMGKRHAQWFLRANIWHRASIWVRPLGDRKILERYAFVMYCRVVRHYGLSFPLPDEKQPLDPSWLMHEPVTFKGVRETEPQLLSRMLYTVAFAHELSFGWYLSRYIAEHATRWNRRISAEYELAGESQGVLLSIEEIVAWARGKSPEEEVGITASDFDYPLAMCHNERDGGFRMWSFTETYAENEEHHYPYPPELKEVVRQIDLTYPDQAITAGQLLALLACYDVKEH